MTDDCEVLGVVAVVMPCYRSVASVEKVIADIPKTVGWIFCVDDASDDGMQETLQKVAAEDKRVQIITHRRNLCAAAIS